MKIAGFFGAALVFIQIFAMSPALPQEFGVLSNDRVVIRSRPPVILIVNDPRRSQRQLSATLLCFAGAAIVKFDGQFIALNGLARSRVPRGTTIQFGTTRGLLVDPYEDHSLGSVADAFFRPAVEQCPL